MVRSLLPPSPSGWQLPPHKHMRLILTSSIGSSGRRHGEARSNEAMLTNLARRESRLKSGMALLPQSERMVEK